MRPTQRCRSTLTGRTVGLVSGLLMLAPCFSQATPSARGLRVPRTGLIVASDVYLRAATYDSAATFVEAMNHLPSGRPIRTCCSGAWRLHFAAQMEQPVGEGTLDLRLYDLSNAERPGQRLRVLFSSIPVHAGDTTIFVNDFVISKDMGFVAGHKYEVSLWTEAGAERNALAKGTFTLK